MGYTARFRICPTIVSRKIGADGNGLSCIIAAGTQNLDRKGRAEILPPNVASNHDGMERFVREAKSAAALNHPNIAHIYEIGESKVYLLHRDGVCRRRDAARKDSWRAVENALYFEEAQSYQRQLAQERDQLAHERDRSRLLLESTICWSQTSTYRISCRQSPRPSGQ
jgi:hypothetical protein